MSTRRAPGSSAPSIISESVEIVGDIDSPGEVQLDGHIKGDIRCNALTLGENGSIKGKVVASTITIRGDVEGELIGSHVRLDKSAKLHGDIIHQSLAVEAGAQISGKIIHSDQPPEQQPLAPVDKGTPDLAGKPNGKGSLGGSPPAKSSAEPRSDSTSPVT